MLQLLDAAAPMYDEMMAKLPLHVYRHLHSKEFRRGALRRFDAMDLDRNGVRRLLYGGNTPDPYVPRHF